ncbi:MAG: hypothetical protein RRC34_10400 [Lentisphaeria bacterium]|nr:hypothetical protein [Lentisphaeria bacterium]
MNTRTLTHRFFTLAITALAVLAVPALTAATVTFNQTVDTEWNTVGNWTWDVGGPGIPTAADDAVIADGKIVFYDADEDYPPIPTAGSPDFGTLTIGVGSTFRYDSIGGTSTDWLHGDDFYFKNNSTLDYISGANNSALDVNIVDGASATIKLPSVMID